jgi:hypothetical protein
MPQTKSFVEICRRYTYRQTDRHPSTHPSIHAYQYIPIHTITYHSIHYIPLHYIIIYLSTIPPNIYLWVINHFRYNPRRALESAVSPNKSRQSGSCGNGYEIQRCWLNEASDSKFIHLYYNIL